MLMTLVAGYLYMQDIQVTRLVAGTKLDFFNFSLFLKGVIIYFPLCSAFAILPFCLYIIRHKYTIIQYLVPYIIICFVVFFGIFPLSIELQSKSELYMQAKTTNELTPLSSGYFRTNDSYIDYYIKNNPDETSTILHIVRPTRVNSSSIITETTIKQNSANYDNFSDPLIFDVFGNQDYLNIIKHSLNFLQLRMKEAYYTGFWHFVAFMSIGFALSSVIGIRKIAKWRLLNLINLFLGYFLIIIINVILYSSNFYTRFSFLESTKSWLPIVVNLLIGTGLIITGILCSIFKLDPNRESD